MDEVGNDKIAKHLLDTSKNIKEICLINLGGDKSFNNWSLFSANVLKLSSMLVNRKSLILNAKNEICTAFLARSVNSFVQILPKTVAGINIFGLKHIFKLGVIFSSIFDVAANYRKIFLDQNLKITFVKIAHESFKMLSRTMTSQALFGLLMGTQYQSMIGPMMLILSKALYITQDKISPEMDFFRDAAEKIFEKMLE